MLAYGRCNMTSEFEEVRKRLNVPVINAMIDTGFKGSEVYRFCLGTGWKAMKGDDAEWGHEPRTGKTIRPVWRRVLVDPSLGTRRARVRQRRLQLNIFQSEAARKLKVSTVTLSRWECDKLYPAKSHQRRIAAYLGFKPFDGVAKPAAETPDTTKP